MDSVPRATDSRVSFQVTVFAVGSQQAQETCRPAPGSGPARDHQSLKGTPRPSHCPGHAPRRRAPSDSGSTFSNPDPTLSPRPSPMPKTCVARFWATHCPWQLLAHVTVSMSPSPLHAPAALAPGSRRLQAAAAAAATALSRCLAFKCVPRLGQEPGATQKHTPLSLPPKPCPGLLRQASLPVILEMAQLSLSLLSFPE